MGKELKMAKNDVCINVMMLGGRRCGKTSVLASIEEQFDKVFGRTNLTIKALDDDTLITLENKKSEANKLYRTYKLNEPFVVDNNPSDQINEYELSVELKSRKNGRIYMKFYDYPGEWLKDKSHSSELNAIMKKCNVFIIAIDTPGLMEDDAPEDTNYSSHIGSFLKNSDQFKEKKSSMILFVPLKCEYYIRNNKMNEVCEKVRMKYEKIINHVYNDFIKNTEMSIIPIQTLGNVQFARYEDQKAFYKFIPDDNGKRPVKPQPTNCEIPAVLILMYLLRLAYISKSKKEGILDKIFAPILQSFFKMPSAEDFLNEYETLKSQLENVKSNDGFDIITDPLKFTK